MLVRSLQGRGLALGVRLQGLVRSLDDRVRLDEIAACGGVQIRRGLGGDGLLQRLALLEQLGDEK